MLNHISRLRVAADSSCAVDVEGRNVLLFGDLNKVGGVGRVETANNQAKIDSACRLCRHTRLTPGSILHHAGGKALGRLLLGLERDIALLVLQFVVKFRHGSLVLGVEHLVHSILPLLGSIADGVERDVMVVDFLRSVSLDHRTLDELTDKLGLSFEHRGLICNADLHQIDVRVKSRRHDLRELLHEFVLRNRAENVVREVFCFLHVFDNDVALCERLRRDSLLVVELAMDDGCVALVLTLLD
mmetsp:Transcript_9923/g.14819  ORF Transcript_9923/g.14819 Transcript_9923/m.14819 type:complete len:243 (-) Transcript_9923:40-768(-)